MDMESFMAQARELQDRVSAAQDLLDKTTVRGISNDGACIVTMTGKYDLKDFKISDALAAAGAEAIADAVTAAFRDAKAKADATIDKIMGDATAGMPMPE
ncbi:MAG: YbaB/EbfC family nucleoid-associated protein [Alphaproteobacteria bacterium]|nr:YbaB/EbfC family nucleoid-associated protein [Alphaproteobacteria bacterium]